MLLETYCEKGHKLSLPDFLQIDREVTDDQKYSMFNLSLKVWTLCQLVNIKTLYFIWNHNNLNEVHNRIANSQI